jgi:outer membrane protein assembly factor BamA
MRVLISFLLTSVLVCIPTAHASQAEPEDEISIGKLDIVSDNLPEETVRALVSRFEQGKCRRDEIKTRVQRDVQTMGYFKAVAEEPEVSFPQRGEQGVASVTIRVHEGTLYHLADIQFLNGAQFPSSRMRALFPLRQGPPFDRMAVGIGMQRLQALYATCGYTTVAIVPTLMLDESSRTINLTIDIDQGERSPSHGCS